MDLPCAMLQCDYLKVLFDITSASDATGLITRSLLNPTLQQQLCPTAAIRAKTQHSLQPGHPCPLFPTTGRADV